MRIATQRAGVSKWLLMIHIVFQGITQTLGMHSDELRLIQATPVSLAPNCASITLATFLGFFHDATSRSSIPSGRPSVRSFVDNTQSSAVCRPRRCVPPGHPAPARTSSAEGCLALLLDSLLLGYLPQRSRTRLSFPDCAPNPVPFAPQARACRSGVVVQ